MKKHSGLRPQDIVILLKIIALEGQSWMMKDLAHSLGISSSEVSESLNRSVLSGFIDPSKKNVFRKSLLEFLQHGLKYVYPQRPGTITRGIPTAHSAPPLKNHFKSEENFVWPSAQGNERGLAIEPLYPGVIQAVQNDKQLYELLILLDAIRVGKVREQQMAMDYLEKKLLNA